MNIDFFENIIEKHIINSYNKTPFIEELHLKSFFWHSDCENNTNHEYIFLAIKGEITDGNLFIPNAITNGYKIIISDNITAIEKYKDIYKDIYFIYVNSIQSVLDEFAIYGISNYYGQKITITGSAGKTTTTYILNNILKNFAKVTVTDKYNSQYYIRRLIFHLFETTSDFFIGELSSDYLGMIHHYSKIIQPDYSIITSIGDAHLEDFECIENIIKEKTSIIPNTLKKVFIPYTYKDLISKERNVNEHLHKIVFIQNDFIIIKNEENITVEFNINGKNITIKNSHLKGFHNYSNINLVLNLLDEIGFINKENSPLIIKTLENLTGFPGRGNTITVKKNNYDFQINCEHHNSNPLSFKAALENISKPTLVIMGFMDSLGAESDEKHYELLNLMNKHPHIKYILTYDKNIYKLNLKDYEKILIKDLEAYDNFNEILNNILNKIASENIFDIFIKGSRNSKLEEVIRYILKISDQK